jgi:hypothetical protein
MDNQPAQPRKTIKSIYFYLVSFVALMMVVFSTADTINIALKTWVFTAADKDMYYGRSACEVPMPENANPDQKVTATITKENCEKQKEEDLKQQEASRLAQKQRDVVRDISMIVVGIPLFLIHWRIVRSKEENL